MEASLQAPWSSQEEGSQEGSGTPSAAAQWSYRVAIQIETPSLLKIQTRIEQVGSIGRRTFRLTLTAHCFPESLESESKTSSQSITITWPQGLGSPEGYRVGAVWS